MLRSALVVLLACSGCITVGSAQPASTLGKGNVVGGVEGSLWSVVVPDQRTATALGVSTFNVLPSVSGVLRVGVSDRVDLGARIGLNGLELQSKFMFTEPGANLIVSLAPQLQGFYFPSITDGMGSSTNQFGMLSVPLPVLVGIRLGAHELVFGVRQVNQLVIYKENFANAQNYVAYSMLFGASAGIALRFGTSFMMIPEIAAQVPVWQTAQTRYGSVSSVGVGSFQLTAGVACVFGKVGGPQASSAPPEPAPESWDDKPPPPPRPQQPQPPPQEWPDDVAPPPPPPPPPPANGA